LTLPSGVEHDGADDDHPILIEGIACDEFEHFVSWIYHVAESQQPGVSSLVAILKVLHLWMIENSINWAINHLEQLGLPPAHKLELACMYTIPQWIAPAM
ncbi:hypothetical protein SCLCIDRAFT_129977, partial [Scleroderma citrinum Foug A]